MPTGNVSNQWGKRKWKLFCGLSRLSLSSACWPWQGCSNWFSDFCKSFSDNGHLIRCPNCFLAGQQTLCNGIHRRRGQQILGIQAFFTVRTAGTMNVVLFLVIFRKNESGASALTAAYLHHHPVPHSPFHLPGRKLSPHRLSGRNLLPGNIIPARHKKSSCS